MRKRLEEPNRWEVHSAEEVDVTLGDLRLRILQQARGRWHAWPAPAGQHMRAHLQSGPSAHADAPVLVDPRTWLTQSGGLSHACTNPPWPSSRALGSLSTLQPHQLAGAGINPDKLGVAAALWDGALVLAGYLAAQPRYRYLGACRPAAACAPSVLWAPVPPAGWLWIHP